MSVKLCECGCGERTALIVCEQWLIDQGRRSA